MMCTDFWMVMWSSHFDCYHLWPRNGPIGHHIVILCTLAQPLSIPVDYFSTMGGGTVQFFWSYHLLSLVRKAGVSIGDEQSLCLSVYLSAYRDTSSKWDRSILYYIPCGQVYSQTRLTTLKTSSSANLSAISFSVRLKSNSSVFPINVAISVKTKDALDHI